MGRCRIERLWSATVLLWIAGASSAFSQTREIVLLYDERPELPGMAMLDAGFTRALTSRSQEHVEIYREAMDLSRFDSETHRNLLRDQLRAKYAGKKIDGVVAVMEPALNFLLYHRGEIFPGTPIVFCGIDRKDLGNRPLPADVTGVLLKREFAPTLALVARLQPDTERVTVVAGTSAFDARLLAQAREEFQPFENRFAFTYLTELPLSELLSRLSQLPPRTVVLYTTMFRDGGGQPRVPHDTAARISAAANAPLYGFLDQYLGHGIVGGRLYGLGLHGEQAAELLLKILSGVKPQELSAIEPVNSVALFDARQLQRWKINEDRLPPGSTVLFREPTVWDRYRGWIIGGLSICILQALLISGLLVNLTRRRRAETKRKEAEKLFRLVTEAAPSGILLADEEGRIVLVNAHLEELFGYKREELVGQMIEVLIPDRCTAEYSALRAAFLATKEPRAMGSGSELFARRKDGTEFPVEIGLNSIRTPRGVLVLASVVDISQRKQAEEDAHRHREQINLLTRVSLLGEMTASLAHELYQPLTAIITNAKTGKRLIDRGAEDREALSNLLADVASDGLRAHDIIQNVRNTVKKGDPTRRRINLNELVTKVAHAVRPDAFVCSCELETSLAEGLLWIEADSIQIQQVLVNLVSNAFDAMRQTPLSQRKVEISTAGGGNGEVRVSVRDHGAGIGTEMHGRLFDHFFTTKEQGLGMGLAIVRSIVESHGGEIHAENVADGGARFYFTLPVAKKT